jgi:hypothetical protein
MWLLHSFLVGYQNLWGICRLCSTRVSQMKTLNMFYLIYWAWKVHNDSISLCSIVLPPVGHSSNHEYHCWNLEDSRAVVWIFIALLRFSCDSPSYISVLNVAGSSKMLVPVCKTMCHIIPGYPHNLNVYHLKTLNLSCKVTQLRIWVFIYFHMLVKRIVI